MDERAIRLEARLDAIEHMLAHLHQAFYAYVGVTPEAIQAAHTAFLEKLRLDFVAGADPAKSDLTMQELEIAYSALLARISGPG
jgi:methylphosphotriester-DNA--protein-cysteine methyltransferase